MESSDKLPKAFQIHKILAIAMASPLAVYLIVVEVLKYQGFTPLSPSESLLANLRFVAVFFAFAAYFIINYLRKKLLVKKPADSHEALLAKLGLVNIICLALSELPALFGLVLFFLSGNPRDFYPLAVISLLLFYAFFPRYPFWAVWSNAPR
jgi:hypothetical protein